MPDIRYGIARDPKWVAMVAPACVLVVEAGLSDDRSGDLWHAVSGAMTVQPILDALTRGGISTTPSFFLTMLPEQFGDAPNSLSVITRGALAVSIRTSADAVELSGEGVSTWVERTVPGATGVSIGAMPDTDASAGTVFVLKFGSAPIAWLSVGAHEEIQPKQPPSPAQVTVVPPSPHAVSVPAPAEVDPGLTITDPTFAAVPTADESEGGYDFLFGETVVRTVEAAAVREEPSAVAGDHDGKTAVGLTASERRAARAARASAPASQAPSAPAFVVVFSTGERELLDQSLIIGRAPSASKVSASSVPRLVTIGGPDQDISRNHVQVSVEGGTVLITDLHSRNGTMVEMPGRPPQQLRGGQPTAVLVDTVVDLGSGISFTVGEN